MYALLLSKNADETSILSLVLQRVGMSVHTVTNPQRAVEIWDERPADVILLSASGDPMPHVHALRAVTSVPLVIITDLLGEEAHVALLEAGADMVIARPYSARLLIAQMRALMRRAGGVSLFSLPTLTMGGLTLDPATRTVQVFQQPPRRLTHLEFRLLYTLMTHQGHILSTESIVERVWGYTGRGDRELVRGLVRRLRTKVEPDPRSPAYILTVPGVGYSFSPDQG
ncbi:MAG: response regulator transcription factor [Anaerolineae bacterium]|nr:response regulator transcription factor [Anaerolineae bacterium]